jgi:hypothetical protein
MKCSTNGMANFKWQISNGKSRFLPFAFCLLPFAMQFAAACPLCKESIPNGMAKGFFWSILLMLAVPAIVVGVIAREVWRAERKKRQLPNVHHE